MSKDTFRLQQSFVIIKLVNYKENHSSDNINMVMDAHMCDTIADRSESWQNAKLCPHCCKLYLILIVARYGHSLMVIYCWSKFSAATKQSRQVIINWMRADYVFLFIVLVLLRGLSFYYLIKLFMGICAFWSTTLLLLIFLTMRSVMDWSCV